MTNRDGGSLTLAVEATGHLSGVITDEQGSGLPGICVQVWDDMGTFDDVACTDDQGNYTFTTLPLDTNLWLLAGESSIWCDSDVGYTDSYWPGTPWYDNAQSF